MIYFITDGEFTKIGTTDNVVRRLADFQIGNARKLNLIAVVDGGHDFERDIHRILPNRARGEWFAPSSVLSDLIEGIVNNCCDSLFARRFVTEKLAERKAWLMRFSSAWENLDSDRGKAITAVYAATVDRFGLKLVAERTGVSENMVRLVVHGDAQPGTLAWLRFEAAFCDLKRLQGEVGALIVEIEGLAA